MRSTIVLVQCSVFCVSFHRVCTGQESDVCTEVVFKSEGPPPTGRGGTR